MTKRPGKHVIAKPGARDDEVLVDYKPEDPAAFSPIEDDLSIPEKRTPTLEEVPLDISPNTDELPAYPAEDVRIAGRKRCHG